MTIEAESYDSLKSISLLESFNGKYYFHGSSNANIDLLEPRDANDMNDPWNRGKWVFATTSPVESMIYSVVDIASIPSEYTKNTSWSVKYEGNQIVAKMPKEWKPYVEETIGSIYVLPKESFTEVKEPHAKSLAVVIPEARVLVKLSDFEKKGGKVIWK